MTIIDRALLTALYVLNKRYDSMREPYRFLILLGLVLIGNLGFGTFELHGNKLIVTTSGLYLIALALARVSYVSGWLRTNDD